LRRRGDAKTRRLNTAVFTVQQLAGEQFDAVSSAQSALFLELQGVLELSHLQMRGGLWRDSVRESLRFLEIC
jgi:hypothetical protein